MNLGIDDTETGDSAVVLLHGLTATRRYVVMGSKHLERAGHRVIAYDARGHGVSDPAERYGYPELADDLARVLDDAGLERAVLAGASMGAHTVIRFALDNPGRVAAACLITPAHDPGADRDLGRWDRLAAGLREGGVEGFVDAYGDPGVPDHFRERALLILRQRLAGHDHPGAVADALEQVPRSDPFADWDDLTALRAPVVVVASRDEFDPSHPFAIGERYAELIPGARLVTEEPGSSPLAWQGGQLSRVIDELAASAR